MKDTILWAMVIGFGMGVLVAGFGMLFVGLAVFTSASEQIPTWYANAMCVASVGGMLIYLAAVRPLSAAEMRESSELFSRAS